MHITAHSVSDRRPKQPISGQEIVFHWLISFHSYQNVLMVLCVTLCFHMTTNQRWRCLSGLEGQNFDWPTKFDKQKLHGMFSQTDALDKSTDCTHRTKQQLLLFPPGLCIISDSQLNTFAPRSSLTVCSLPAMPTGIRLSPFFLLLGIHWLNSVLHPTSCADILISSHVHIHLPINSRLYTIPNERGPRWVFVR